MKLRLLLLMTLLAASCGVADNFVGELTAIDPSDGPYARSAVVGINYPAGAPQVGVDIDSLVAEWGSLAEQVDNLPMLVEMDGESMWVAESDASGVALDVIVNQDVVVLAQLQIVDAAGESDESAAALVLSEFLAALNVGDPTGVFDQLGIADPLFSERSETLEVGELTIYLASNKDTILVGVTGAP